MAFSFKAYLDERILTKRLKEYVQMTGRSIPTTLNRAGRSACYKAIRKTKKTTIAQITADVGTPAHPSPKGFAIYLKNHPGAPMAGLTARVRRMVAVKRSSIAYIKAGFLRALRVFTPTTKDVTPQSLAARGYGIKARPDRKYSEIMNTAPGADTVAAAPLREASLEAVEDMSQYFMRQQMNGARRFNR
jgi:hypothetical protein